MLESLEPRQLMTAQSAVVLLPAGFDAALYANIGPQFPSAISALAETSAQSTSPPERFASTAEFEAYLLAKADRLYGEFFGRSPETFPPFMINGWPNAPFSGDGAAIFGNQGLGQQGSIAGIDEPQPTASDGRYFYLLQDGELLIFTAPGVGSPALVSRTKIEGYAPGLYLDGDRLTIISQDYGYRFLDSGWPSKGSGREKEATNLIVLDISDRAAPALVSQTDFDGYLFSARRVDGRVHLTLASDLTLPIPLVERIEDAASGEMTWKIETQANYHERLRPLLTTVLPSFKQRTVGDAGARQVMTRATDLYKAAGAVDDVIISVVAIDTRATQPFPQAATSVLGSNRHAIYSSADNLYLIEQNEDDAGKSLEVRKVHYTATGVEFAASGTFAGSLLGKPNEHAGLLQLPVTQQTGAVVTHNVLILSEQSTDLAVVGTLPNLASGVQISSVRLIGSRGLVFAANSAGPLFTLDLSDPTNPRVAATPLLPDLTTTFQTLDAHTLLSIGFDRGPAGDERGMLVTLFDITDIAAPRVAGQVHLAAGESSSAESDRRRILWDPASRTLAFPTFWASRLVPIDIDRDGQPDSWESRQDRSLVVLDVSPTLELTIRGHVLHDREVLWGARVGDAIYSVSTETVQASSLSSPDTAFGEVDFGRAFVGKQYDPFRPGHADLLLIGGYEADRFRLEPLPDGRLEARRAGAVVGVFDLDEIRSIVVEEAQHWLDRVVVKNWRLLPSALDIESLRYLSDIGDADRSGVVDLSDFALLKSQFGRQGAKLAGDIDRDGEVDLDDLGILRSNFGLPAEYAMNFNEIVLPDGTIGQRPIELAALAIDAAMNDGD